MFKAKIVTFICGVDNECRCSTKDKEEIYIYIWIERAYILYNVNYNMVCEKLKICIVIHRAPKKCKEVELKSQHEFKIKF